jgi:hypothetical protein
VAVSFIGGGNRRTRVKPTDRHDIAEILLEVALSTIKKKLRNKQLF